jgi:hypothetical protein
VIFKLKSAGVLSVTVQLRAAYRFCKFVFPQRTSLLAFVFLCVVGITVSSADPGRKVLRETMPSVVSRLVPLGQLSATTNLSLAFGLPLRDEAGLDQLLAQLYDSQSTNYHKYLTPQQFTARFGPTEADYAIVENFAITNGFVITGTHPNRVVLDVSASAANINRAFQVTLRNYRHPHETRNFFAPDVAPTVSTAIPVLQISGLDNYSLRRPMSVIRPLTATAQAVPHGGSGSGGTYIGDDFRAAYVPGTTLTGSGQSVALLQFDGYYSNDIAAYISLAGLTNYPISITNVPVNGGVSTPGSGNIEVSLDIEMAISMAPGLAKIIVYEAPISGTSWSTILSQIANDNLAKQISCSWGATSPGAKDPTSEGIFKQMAAQGQCFFNATGDSDAFVGGIPFPSESTNITQVGGTTLSTTGPDGAWSAERAWNWGGGTGTSGGISANYGIPGWQQGIDMTSNQGSTISRNVPDVALTGDNVYVVYNNGSSGTVGGTSCAAPLWAAFMALVNQQAAQRGQAPMGFINPAVYAIGKSAIYNSCFNDISVGNNFSSSSPTNFPAVAGYDLCTGWGTPNGTNLINALLSPPPLIVTQPMSRNVINGANVTLTATASGGSPLGYSWLFNGTTLANNGHLAGSTTSALSITSVTTNDIGSYQLVVTNVTGSATSSVAILNVGFAPTVSVQPTGQTNLTGSTTTFFGTVGGSAPLVFQWRRNGANLVNGAAYSGVTTSNLSFNAIATNQAGNYTLVVTNLFGAITSSASALTVVLPPTITSGMTNRAIECSSNVTFSMVATGTAPLHYQWSVDGIPMAGATSTSFSLTNVHLPSHIVTVIVTNLYASATSNALLTVNDTKAPLITLKGSNPMFVELGGAFADLGATANDACAGAVVVIISGVVNPNVVGTNVLVYTADDGNGNTNSTTRTVIVRDTTPPTIVWSFTNLVLAADANCSAAMPDVTGTNYIVAQDLSGAIVILQSPTNNSTLTIGTNVILLRVSDVSGNAADSTNTIVVSDTLPPVIVIQPTSQTSQIGTNVTFAFAATACTPIAYQWFFQDEMLDGETNSILAFTNLQSTDAGDYFALASAAGGCATSAVVSLGISLANNIVITNNGVVLTLVGSPGGIYILETTTNLFPTVWLPVDTNTLGTNGLWQFYDPASASFPQRFYRLRSAP